MHDPLTFLLDPFKIYIKCFHLLYDSSPYELILISWNRFTSLETFVTWYMSFIQAPYHPSNPGRRPQLHRGGPPGGKLPVANSQSFYGRNLGQWTGISFLRIMYLNSTKWYQCQIGKGNYIIINIISVGGIYFPLLNHWWLEEGLRFKMF